MTVILEEVDHVLVFVVSWILNILLMGLLGIQIFLLYLEAGLQTCNKDAQILKDICGL